MSKQPLVTVGALIENPLKQILIIKTHKWRDRWGVPGGKVKLGEGLHDALKREIYEETALRIYNIRPAPTQEAISSHEFYRDTHMILLNYIAQTDHNAVTLNDEAQMHCWLFPQEALHYALNSFTHSLITYYLSQTDTPNP